MQGSDAITVLGLAGALAALMGAAIAHSNFCTMGAIADWVTMHDQRRLHAWLLVITIATVGVALLQAFAIFDPADTRIPYASVEFAWPRYVLGGFMFGIGMALSAGCPSKNLVRAGMGSGKAIVVVVVVAVTAYIMGKGGLYAATLHRWLSPWYIDLGAIGIADQRLPTMVGSIFGTQTTPDMLVALSVGALGLGVVSSGRLRSRTDLVIASAVIGLVIVGGWYLTAGPLGRRWIENAEFQLVVPAGVGIQSFTFVGPLSDTVAYTLAPRNLSGITFGMAGVAGLVLGAAAYGLITGRARWEWFQSMRDLIRHSSGGLLLGAGGMVAMGCTVGQGMTGISTLALGSFLATGSVTLGCALTIKTEYYKMVYGDSASWSNACVSAAIDLHLLPAPLRRLKRLV